MTARLSNWHKGPRGIADFFLRKVLVSVAREGKAIGVRLDLESTKGRAVLVVDAIPDLPAAVAVLERLRDACNQALSELEAAKRQQDLLPKGENQHG